MSERNIYVAIVIFVASLILLSMVKLTCARAPSGGESSTIKTSAKPDGNRTRPESVGHSYSGEGFQQRETGLSPEVVQEIAQAREALLKDQVAMEKAGAEWLKKYLDDPGVSSLTKEIYRARNNKNVQNGYALLFKGDYVSAKDEFLKAYNDPASTPAIKFMCSNFLMSIALQEKNPDDYFQWGIAKGELLAKEDLSCMEQEKSDYYLTVIKEKKIIFQARENTAKQNAIAEFLLSDLPQDKLTERDREWARKEVKIRIQSIEKEIFR